MNIQKVLSIVYLTEFIFILRIERPSKIIRAGQCFNLGIPSIGINREYSMCSSIHDPFLEFLIRIIPGGMVSEKLSMLSPGDYVEVDGPYGEFCIDNIDLESQFMFIASGTGIAPFVSYIKSYPQIQFQIIHGVRYTNEIFLEFRDMPNYFPCISQDHLSVIPCMRVTDYLNKFPQQNNKFFFLCGNRNMIVDSVAILIENGISGDRIFSEAFF